MAATEGDEMSVFMVSNSYSDVALHLMPYRFAVLDMPSNQAEESVVKDVRAVTHGKAEVRFLPAPRHRRGDFLFQAIPDAKLAAVEQRRRRQERLDGVRRRIRLEARHVAAGTSLAVDLKARCLEGIRCRGRFLY